MQKTYPDLNKEKLVLNYIKQQLETTTSKIIKKDVAITCYKCNKFSVSKELIFIQQGLEKNIYRANWDCPHCGTILKSELTK